MKRLVLIAFLILIINNSFAQYQGEIRVQLGNEFGMATNLYGFGLVGEYMIIDRLSVVPSAIVLLPQTGKATSLNIDARYYITEGLSQFYGFLGLNNSRRRLEFAIPGEELINRTGINVGAGHVYRLSEEFAINSQLKYQPHYNNNFVIGLGIVYFIN